MFSQSLKGYSKGRPEPETLLSGSDEDSQLGADEASQPPESEAGRGHVRARTPPSSPAAKKRTGDKVENARLKLGSPPSKASARDDFKGSPFKESKVDGPKMSDYARFTDLEDALNFTATFLRKHREHELLDWGYEGLAELSLKDGCAVLKQVCAPGIQNPSALLRWAIRKQMTLQEQSGMGRHASLQPQEMAKSAHSAASSVSTTAETKGTKRQKRLPEEQVQYESSSIGVRAKLPGAAAFCARCGEARRCSTELLSTKDSKGPDQTIYRYLSCMCGCACVFQSRQVEGGGTVASFVVSFLHHGHPTTAPAPAAGVEELPDGAAEQKESLFSLVNATRSTVSLLTKGDSFHERLYCSSCGDTLGAPTLESQIGDLQLVAFAFTCRGCSEHFSGHLSRNGDVVKFCFLVTRGAVGLFDVM